MRRTELRVRVRAIIDVPKSVPFRSEMSQKFGSGTFLPWTVPIRDISGPGRCPKNFLERPRRNTFWDVSGCLVISFWPKNFEAGRLSTSRLLPPLWDVSDIESLSQSVCKSVSRSVSLSVSQLSVCHSVSQSVSWSVCQSVYLSATQSVIQPVSHSVCQLVSQSVSQSVCQCQYFSQLLSLSDSDT